MLVEVATNVFSQPVVCFKISSFNFMLMSVCPHVCLYALFLQRPEEGRRFPIASVTDV